MRAKSFIVATSILIWVISACSETHASFPSLYSWLDAQSIQFPDKIHWDVIETYNQTSNIQTNPIAETLKRSYLGYYGQNNVVLRINIEISQYRDVPSTPKNEDAYSYGFTPDTIFVPEIKALDSFDARKIECGRNSQESYTLCIVNINFNNRYIIYVVAHGNSQINNDDWGIILNNIISGMNINELASITR